MKFGQGINRFSYDNPQLKFALLHTFFQHLLKMMGNGADKMYGYVLITAVFTYVTVEEFAQRIGHQPLNIRVLQMVAQKTGERSQVSVRSFFINPVFDRVRPLRIRFIESRIQVGRQLAIEPCAQQCFPQVGAAALVAQQPAQRSYVV